jgi:predicted  nucleic acid-binding Zn-ribbon protein
MQNIQEIFDRIQQKKAESKELKTIVKDALANSYEYQEIQEELKKIKQKKKEIESTIKAEAESEIVRLEELKLDIKTDQEMLRDIALTSLMQGDQVQITDEYDRVYEPIFSVKFKKMN